MPFPLFQQADLPAPTVTERPESKPAPSKNELRQDGTHKDKSDDASAQDFRSHLQRQERQDPAREQDPAAEAPNRPVQTQTEAETGTATAVTTDMPFVIPELITKQGEQHILPLGETEGLIALDQDSELAALLPGDQTTEHDPSRPVQGLVTLDQTGGQVQLTGGTESGLEPGQQGGEGQATVQQVTPLSDGSQPGPSGPAPTALSDQGLPTAEAADAGETSIKLGPQTQTVNPQQQSTVQQTTVEQQVETADEVSDIRRPQATLTEFGTRADTSDHSEEELAFQPAPGRTQAAGKNVPLASTFEAVRSAQAETKADQAIANQINRAVVQQITDGQRQITLRLTPPELGTVRVQIIEQAGQLQVKLGAEDDGVRMALERALPSLRQDLRGLDAPITDINVLDQHFTFSEHRETGQGQDSGRGHRDRQTGFHLDGLGMEAEDDLTHERVGADGVDIHA